MHLFTVTSIMSLLREQNMFSYNSWSHGLKTRRSTDIPGGKIMELLKQTVCKLSMISLLDPIEATFERNEITVHNANRRPPKY